MDFKAKYSREEYIRFFSTLFGNGNFQKIDKPTPTQSGSFGESMYFKHIHTLGLVRDLDGLDDGLIVLEIQHQSSRDARVGLTKELMKLLSSMEIEGTYRGNALVILTNPNDDTYRLSLFTTSYDKNQGYKKVLSNPRRQSFLLGQKKVHTPKEQLEKKGTIISFEDLKKRFSIEVVNKEFYKNISEFFYALTGGTFVKGKQTYTVEPVMFYPGVTNDKKKDELTRKEFGVRLFGRIMFCWFLKQKVLEDGNGLIPSSILSSSVATGGKYYNSILEPLFFEILNKPNEDRKESYKTNGWATIPYLNGGLFHPQQEDYFDKSPLEVYIPDDWFKQFFEFLELYNFTIDENTSIDQEMSVDPEMLGRIFENLLAEINPETGESARKSTGSFYTPREIVEYMVDESIIQYLLTHTEIEEDKIRALISYDLDDDQDFPLTTDDNEVVFKNILNLKIFDPACGSGAYPIGVLQKILYIMQTVDPDGNLWTSQKLSEISDPMQRDIMRKAYEKKDINYLRKLTIIRDIIYGCDIQSIAVETSKLRCFLTLIVDEKIDKNQDNFGIEPLPNLEFKFVCANTLIPLNIDLADGIDDDIIFGKNKKIRQNQIKMNLGEQEAIMNNIFQKRLTYFSSHHRYKQKIKTEIVNLQTNLLNLLRKGILGGDINDDYSIEVMKLIDWDMFEQGTAKFFDLYWMYGMTDGFDIVIGNPPYGADIDKFTNLFAKIYPETTKGFKEIYKLFYDRGITNLAKEGGILAYINPNTILLQPRYEDLRKFLLKKTILNILNLGDGVFEDVVAPTCIIICANSSKGGDLKYFEMSKNGKFTGLNFSIFKSINQNNFLQNKSLLFTVNSLETDPTIIPLKEILECKDAGINYQRVNVGLTDKGNSDLSTRLLYEGIREDDSHIEFWKGTDIDRYFIAPNTSRFVRPEVKYSLASNERIVLNQEYFALSPKILWRQTASFPMAIIDNKGVWFGRSIQAGIIKNSNFSYEYIVGILNSKYIKSIYSKNVQEGGRVFPQVKLSKLQDLPIKLLTPIEQQPFKKLVNQILEIKKHDPKATTLDLEKQIDQLIYQLYNLTPEEIAIVEGNIS